MWQCGNIVGVSAALATTLATENMKIVSRKNIYSLFIGGLNMRRFSLCAHNHTQQQALSQHILHKQIYMAHNNAAINAQSIHMTTGRLTAATKATTERSNETISAMLLLVLLLQFLFPCKWFAGNWCLTIFMCVCMCVSIFLV